MFLMVVLLAGCDGQDKNVLPSGPTFERVGLEGRIVYRIEDIDGTLHAATDRGLYRQAEDGAWTLMGRFEWRILDWARLGNGHWLLSVADGSDYEPISDYGVFESVDDGATWSELDHDFGGDEPGYDEPEPVLKWQVVGNDLYATGWGALAQSVDGGRQWTLVDGLWRALATGLRALSLSPDQQSLWYGGQGGFENLVLGRYALTESSPIPVVGDLSEHLPAPSVVKAIRFDPFTAGRVFVAAEGGIVQSRDDGANWQPFLLNDTYRFHFELIADPDRAGHFYTVGWSKIPDEPQPLILEVTRDDGATWERHVHPDPTLWGGAYSMTTRVEAGERVLYVGLFKGGVMRVSRLD